MQGSQQNPEKQLTEGYANKYTDQEKGSAYKAIIGTLAVICLFLLLHLPDGKNTLQEIAWACVFCIALLIRYIHKRKNQILSSQRGKSLQLYSLIAGACWGLLPVVFQPGTFTEHSLMSAVICAALTVATTTLSTKKSDYLILSSAAVLPLIIYHLYAVEVKHTVLAVMVFLYYLVLIKLNSHPLELDVLPKRKASKQVKSSNNSKIQFNMNMGHDLKQPIHALGLCLDNLGNPKISAANKDLMLANCEKSLASLESFFTSIVDVSNINSGSIHGQPSHFEVKRLLEKISSQIENSINPLGISIQLNTPAKHIAFYDSNICSKIVNHLVKNAIVHSQGSKVTLSSIKHKNHIEVRVEDDGLGMNVGDSEHSLNKQKQIKNNNRGLGLGLQIVKGLLDHHKQKYSIQSSEQGTCFSFNLPLGDEKQLIKQSVQPKPNTTVKLNKNIVVLDSDSDSVGDTLSILESLGQTPVAVNTVQEALEIMGKLETDLLIYDFKSQQVQASIDDLQKLKSIAKNEFQIILISDETEPSNIKEIRQHGYPLLHKPLNIIAVKSLLNKSN